MSINRVIISGNTTRDLDLRATTNGSLVGTFSVAVNDRRKNSQTGEWEGVPNFVDCILFGARAEKLQQYMTKGTKVAIEGKLRYSSWEKDGVRRSRLEVVVDEIELMGRKSSQSAPNSPQATPQPQADPEMANEDIPF